MAKGRIEAQARILQRQVNIGQAKRCARGLWQQPIERAEREGAIDQAAMKTNPTCPHRAHGQSSQAWPYVNLRPIGCQVRVLGVTYADVFKPLASRFNRPDIVTGRDVAAFKIPINGITRDWLTVTPHRNDSRSSGARQCERCIFNAGSNRHNS